MAAGPGGEAGIARQLPGRRRGARDSSARGIAIADLAAEQVDGLYRELERHGKAAGRCRTAGVTCKEHGCALERHDGLGPKSVRHVHTMLRKTLSDAVAHDRLAPAWQLVATTGLRRAELCGPRWSDVDLEQGRLRIARTVTEVRGQLVVQNDGKTDAAERSLALDARTVEALRRWKKRQAEERLASPGEWHDTDLVFTHETREGYRPKRLSSEFTQPIDHAGLPRIGVHGIRHTAATLALRAGVSPEIVSKRHGHSSVVVTLSIDTSSSRRTRLPRS